MWVSLMVRLLEIARWWARNCPPVENGEVVLAVASETQGGRGYGVDLSSMGTSFGIWGLLEENQTIHATLNGLNQTKAEILWMADGEVVQSGGTALTLTDLHVGKSISASLLSDSGGSNKAFLNRRLGTKYQ